MSKDENEVEEIKQHLDEKIKEANEAAEEVAKQKAEDAKEELTEKQEELHGEIKDLAQKLSDAQEAQQKELDELKTDIEKGKYQNGQEDSVKKAFSENAEKIKGMQSKSMGKRASFTVKGLLEKATMTTGDSLGDRRVIPYERVTQTPVFDPEERPIRDYINTATISSDSAEWPIEQTADGNTDYDYTNNADAVDSDNAEQKPESEFNWDLETRTVRDIAHTVRLHKNLMNDLPLLQSYLPNRLRDGLLREESRQILSGQDTNQELIGWDQTGSHVDFDNSGFQAAVVNNGKSVSDANYIDILGYAMTQLRLNNYSATRIFINPEDWYSFMFSVNADSDYHMNNPVWLYVANMIVQSNYITQSEFFAMDANRATTLFQRENINIEFSYEDRDNFVKNLVTIRAEERAVQVTERPNGLVYGDFADAVATS